MNIKLTKEMIEAGSTNNTGYNKRQFECLGLSYPPPHNWKNRMIGQFIDDKEYKIFLLLQGIPQKKLKKAFPRRKERHLIPILRSNSNYSRAEGTIITKVTPFVFMGGTKY
jgi:hypothetical protein